MAKRIMIVEDDPIVVKYLKALFDDNGYETVVAYDGTEAENAVKEAKPDLITLDLELPKEWGPRFYRKMRKDEKFKDIPVIVISGLSNPKHAITKAVAVLRKPFDEERLLGIVKSTVG
ncbi:MAG: response regulator [Thermodesulfobacteriota bacterium]|nr:response regulator [Thermodesulfobacteriota bacterium]